jgi:hypothetical protein
VTSPLALSGISIGVLFVGVPITALAGYVAYTHLFGPRFVDCHTAVLVAESPAAAVGLARLAVAQEPRYTYRLVGSTRLEIIYGDTFPDEAAERQLPEISNALLDLLVVTAEPVAPGTEVRLVGRAEPRVIKGIRSKLDAARPPAGHDRGQVLH